MNENDLRQTAPQQRGMSFDELRRRRRMLEAEVAIEEIRLIENVRKITQPLSIVRSVSSFAFNRFVNGFSLIDGIIYGFRSASWLSGWVRRLIRR